MVAGDGLAPSQFEIVEQRPLGLPRGETTVRFVGGDEWIWLRLRGGE